jgi:hypothetical protein
MVVPFGFGMPVQKIGKTLEKKNNFFLVNMPKSFNLAYNKEQTIIKN